MSPFLFCGIYIYEPTGEYINIKKYRQKDIK